MDKAVKQGVQGKRIKAGWDNSYLFRILNVKFSIAIPLGKSFFRTFFLCSFAL